MRSVHALGGGWSALVCPGLVWSGLVWSGLVWSGCMGPFHPIIPSHYIPWACAAELPPLLHRRRLRKSNKAKACNPAAKPPRPRNHQMWIGGKLQGFLQAVPRERHCSTEGYFGKQHPKCAAQIGHFYALDIKLLSTGSLRDESGGGSSSSSGAGSGSGTARLGSSKDLLHQLLPDYAHWQA